MSLTKLARKSAVVTDAEPEGPQEIAAVEPAAEAVTPSTEAVAEAAAATEEPARASVLRRGPVASPSTSIMDEAVDSSFASSIESGIADAVDSNRPTLDDDEPAPGAEDADTEPKPATTETKSDTSEKTEDEDDELNLVTHTGPGPFLNLSGLSGLGRSHDVLVELLASAVNREDAVKMALEYNTHLQTEVLPAIDALNLTVKEREEMIRRAEAETARQTTGGGGFLSSLFGAMRKPGKAFMREMDAIGADRRRILEQNSGFAQQMANRMSQKIKQNYVATLCEAANAGEALKRGVNSYNAAIFDAPEAAELKQDIIDRATATNTSPDSVLRAISEGTDYPDLVEKLAAIPQEVYQRPDVKSAAEAMAAAQEELRDAFRRAGQQAETLQKNIYDTDLDIEQMRDQLLKAVKIAEEETPRPVDKAKAEEMKQRLADMQAAIQEQFRQIIERLAEALGAKPK